MRTDRMRRWALGARGVGFALAVSLLALAPPAGAQGLGLKQLEHMMAWENTSLILFDQLEFAPEAEGRPLSADLTAWYGGAYNRLWLRAEGELPTSEGAGEGEVQLSYGRLVTPNFDALAGVRVDQRGGEESGTRAHLAVGLQGLAPFRFEFSPTLFLSQDGDLSARIEAEYEVLVTQRLVASPEIEVNAALQEVPGWGVGKGLNDYELGVRLRYEIEREFAPYIGYSWSRRVGGAADLARAEGESISEGAFVAGFRIWR